MAAKPETTFIGSVNKLLPIKRLKMCDKARGSYPREHWLHYEKMNNPYSSGTADGWYSGQQDIWIEYKFLPRVPQRGTVKPMELLSALQADWLRERHKEGRNVAVILGCPTGGVVFKNLQWDQEVPAQKFTSMILSRPALAEWIMSEITR